MYPKICLTVCLSVLLLTPLATASAQAPAANPTPQELLKQSKRIVFLGDSITAAGEYVAYFDAWLLTQGLEKIPTVINVGLPSETVSGLSEDGHAGGAFPRPDLAERLDRVLKVTKPDLVVACYGMNCGIYLPFDEGRLKKYQEGIQHLKGAVEQAGAKLVLVTPPFYDDLRSPRDFSYNGVLDRYAQWLLEQRQAGWMVADLHVPMTKEVAKRRVADPKFTFQPDGVHPNSAGHWFVAQQVIAWFGDESATAAATPEEFFRAKKLPAEVLPLIKQRTSLLRDSYVGTAGHKRPGVAKGLPIPEAEQKAAELTKKIKHAIAPK